MKNRTLLTIGIVIAALCCFTPLLVVLRGVVGLSAWLDYVLLPSIGIFIVITIYTVVRRMKRDRVSDAQEGVLLRKYVL